MPLCEFPARYEYRLIIGVVSRDVYQLQLSLALKGYNVGRIIHVAQSECGYGSGVSFDREIVGLLLIMRLQFILSWCFTTLHDTVSISIATYLNNWYGCLSWYITYRHHPRGH